MSLRNLMNSTVTVSYVSKTKDRTRGSWTETTGTRYANMPCRICPVGGGETSIYRGTRADCTHTMFVEGAYGKIEEADKVTDSNGRVYDVLLVKNPSTMGHHFEVELRELRPNI